MIRRETIAEKSWTRVIADTMAEPWYMNDKIHS